MKHPLRKLSVLLIVVLALALAAPALAQGGDPACTGLSDADCQLLLSAGEAMTGISSFSAPAWSLDLNFSDGTQQFSLNASGSGAFQFSADASQLLVHLVIDQASLVTPNGSQAGAAEIIMTQDMGYVYFNGEWYGGELTEEDLGGLGDITDLGSLMGSTEGMGDLSAAGIDLTGALSTTRGADEEIGGQPSAVFTTNINVGQLLVAVLASPMVGEMLGAAGGDLGMGEMTPEDMQMMGMFLTPLLGQSTVSVGQWVGLNDNMLHKIALDVVIDLNLSAFDPEAAPITGNITFASEIGAFNEPVSVSFPDSYRPIEELQAQLEALNALMDF
ncbi:MAG: hypothetical protein Kow00106_24470 [Anaerolineae bacterium]